MDLMSYVKTLEGRTSRDRGWQVARSLREMGLRPAVQRCRWLRVQNIMVDFALADSAPANRLLFSAHYDVVKGSAGANDNASGVAVLLELCWELKGMPAPVTIVFFDREEAWLRTPVLRLGSLGSLCYAFSRRLSGVSAVYNLDGCGDGDTVAVWPVKERDGLPALQAVRQAAEHLRVPHAAGALPWILVSSDHLSFRLRGLRNAVTLSILPGRSIEQLKTLATRRSLPGLLRSGRRALPEPLSRTHTMEDSSDHLSEKSLQTMLSIVRYLARVSPRQ